MAIGSEFLTAFAQLPNKQQSKVSQFLEKFCSNPMATGINYEKIHGATDDNLRSVRIDQTYRGIVLRPAQGNVYLLLWVDHHDDAYAWAAKRRFTINAHTGSLQVVPTDDVQAAEQPTIPSPPEPTGLFKHVKDKHLLKLGVPEDLLPPGQESCFDYLWWKTESVACTFIVTASPRTFAAPLHPIHNARA